jgi:hypothetical protein
MTPEEIAREWTNVNQVMELVKQEGDANCERAFDFLLSALAASEQRGKAIIEDRRKVVDLLNKAAAKLQASEQRVRELEDKLTLSANEDAAWTKRALASERETAIGMILANLWRDDGP